MIVSVVPNAAEGPPIDRMKLGVETRSLHFAALRYASVETTK
jgi:hypothetical protein